MKKKTTIDKLAHKYALNIKQIRGPGPQKVADFKNLNKNFYDDIESSNISIKDNSKILDDIKNKSIKEFIYTNKIIPDIWKKKLNYPNEIIKVITKDKNLLSYVGTSSRGEKKFSFDNKFPKINSRYGAMNITRSRNSETNNSEKIRAEKSDMQNKDNEQSNLSDSYNKGIRNKFSFSKKNELSEKEINALMEEYKTTFPIKEKLQELYITSNYYKINKNKNDQITVNDENSENKIINAHQTHNSINSNTMSQMKRNTYNSLNSVNKKIVSKKQKTFRQNIFNNLSPSNENTFYTLDKSNLMNINKSSNIIRKKNAQANNNNTQKIIEITNPIIKKNVESINNFGPYFSFCPSCRNKNMEFYNNLEPNHCLELIHYIKKIRNKNPLLEIRRRTASVSPNIQSNNQKETVESDRILSENEKGDNFV
jgi:hypothetical protein